MDRTVDDITLRLPWRNARKRVGTFEVLRPYLHQGLILVIHHGLRRRSDGELVITGSGIVNPGIWFTAREDRQAQQVIFITSGVEFGVYFTEELFAYAASLELDGGAFAMFFSGGVLAAGEAPPQDISQVSQVKSEPPPAREPPDESNQAPTPVQGAAETPSKTPPPTAALPAEMKTALTAGGGRVNVGPIDPTLAHAIRLSIGTPMPAAQTAEAEWAAVMARAALVAPPPEPEQPAPAARAGEPMPERAPAVEPEPIPPAEPLIAREPATPVVIKSGAPGRPTSMHLVEAELNSRIIALNSDELLGNSIKKVADDLSNWLKNTHPKHPRCKGKTIKNKLGSKIRPHVCPKPRPKL